MTQDTPYEPPQLTQSDLASPVWLKLEKYFNQELERLHLANERVMFEQQRGEVLGQIKQIRAFLRLGKPTIPAAP